jgi:hypothetical protein
MQEITILTSTKLSPASSILNAKTVAFMATPINIGATDSPPRLQQNRAALVRYVKLTIDRGTGTTWRYRPAYEDIKVGEAPSESV